MRSCLCAEQAGGRERHAEILRWEHRIPPLLRGGSQSSAPASCHLEKHTPCVTGSFQFSREARNLGFHVISGFQNWLDYFKQHLGQRHDTCLWPPGAGPDFHLCISSSPSPLSLRAEPQSSSPVLCFGKT